jgi:uncharacterized protein YndB with AHSA1/START domain
MSISLRQHITIDAEPTAVWAVVADYARDVHWRGGVSRMDPSPPGPVQVGTTTVEDMAVAGKTMRNLGEVLEVDPGRSFRWRTTEGADAHGSRTVVPAEGGGSVVRLELVVTPHGPEKLLVPIFRRLLGKGMCEDLARLKELVEAEVTQAA